MQDEPAYQDEQDDWEWNPLTPSQMSAVSRMALRLKDYLATDKSASQGRQQATLNEFIATVAHALREGLLATEDLEAAYMSSTPGCDLNGLIHRLSQRVDAALKPGDWWKLGGGAECELE